MNLIGFSHHYTKMHGQTHGKLIQVTPFRRQGVHRRGEGQGRERRFNMKTLIKFFAFAIVILFILGIAALVFIPTLHS
ncbi:MAG: hypothetical protein J6Q22_10975 [Prevotella sp.]|nr:hypothetical protein [Prevotella sp.]